MPPASRPPLPVRWTSAAHPVFVGRRRELAVLEQVWASVERGARQVVLVGGEPGAGKSRLAAELATEAHQGGATVLVGACAAEGGPPYQPFVEPVEALLAAGLPADPRLRDRLAALVGRASAGGPGGEREYRRELFDAAVAAVREAAADRPLVAVLEDLHWAGTDALRLLAAVVEGTPDTPLLLLGTARTTAPDRSVALVQTVAQLFRSEGVRRLDLAGLGTDDVLDYLVRELAVPARRARPLAVVLREQSGGNPFFLRELCRDLAARGAVSARGAEGAPAPASVRETLALRLERLAAPARQVLEVAAVVGEDVPVAVLLAAASCSEETVLAALDAAVDFALLEPAPGPEEAFRFPHALARQAVLELLPATRRARQHARVAEVLESLPEGSPRHVQRLAYHHAHARGVGDAGRAVQRLTAAGHAADASLAHAAAAAWFEQAADLAGDGATGDGLRLAAARSHLLGGDFARARQLDERVATSGSPRDRLRAAVGYEAASWRPGLPGYRAVALLRDALAGVPPDDADPLRVRALASLGRALAFTGETAAAARLGRHTVARARALADDDLLAHVLQASLWQGLQPEDAPAKLQRAVELSELAHRTGDLGHLGPAAYYRAVISYVQGDPGGMAAGRADLLRTARATGQGFFEYMTGCVDYARQFLAGEFLLAERTSEGLLDLGESFGTDDTGGPYGVQVFMVRRETGALDQVRGLVTGEEEPGEHWAPGLLALYTELGLTGPASRLLHRLLDRELDCHRDSAQWPAVLAFLTEAALATDDAPAAARLRPALAEYAGLNLVGGQFVALFGAADRHLGQVDSLLGRGDPEECLQRALALDERMAAPVHQAQTLAALAAHRCRIGAGGRRVAEVAQRARELAESLGLRRVLRDLAARGLVAAPGPSRPDGLTGREVEVLRLLGEGLTNREIAGRLVISEHTAAHHVRAILLKTGCANRTRAARYAAARGLV